MSSDLPAEREPENGMSSVIRSLAENPNVDVDKLRQIMEMQEHILDRNAEQAFNASMVLAQRSMPIVPKDKKNTQTDSFYSKYETVLKHCKPIYTEHGFSVMFYEGDAKRENEIRVMADVMHREGHKKTVWVDVPLDMTGIKGSVNKTATHGKGSSVSYGRGYLIRMIFNIPTGDDDDGNGAGGARFITDEQCLELDAIVTDNNLNANGKWLGEFLAYLKVDSFDQLPAKDFGKAKAALQGIVAKRAKK